MISHYCSSILAPAVYSDTLHQFISLIKYFKRNVYVWVFYLYVYAPTVSLMSLEAQRAYIPWNCSHSWDSSYVGSGN